MRRRATRSRKRSPLRVVALFMLAAIALDAVYLAWIWPDWDRIAAGPVPKSSFIRNYERERARRAQWPRLRWEPVALGRIPGHVVRAVVVAEDARFYEHDGVDFAAVKDAFEHNLERGEVVYGASTISQQTVKNLFLSASRDPLRKWHELILTWAMESRLSKRRILELYLNSAEFGLGVYGVEAAARHYWGVSAASLSRQQAIELAASLPSPRLHNPDTRTRTFLARVRRISRWMS